MNFRTTCSPGVSIKPTRSASDVQEKLRTVVRKYNTVRWNGDAVIRDYSGIFDDSRSFLTCSSCSIVFTDPLSPVHPVGDEVSTASTGSMWSKSRKTGEQVAVVIRVPPHSTCLNCSLSLVVHDLLGASGCESVHF